MGRPRKPTALKLVTGNPGKRGLNDHEPEPDKLLDVTPPKHLSDRSAAVWREIAPMLKRIGVLTEADVIALEMLCDYVSDYRHARAELGLGFVLKNKNTGVESLSQWLIAKSISSKRAEVFMAKFGMDPVSRSKVMVDPQGSLFDKPPATGPGRHFAQ